EVKVVPMLDHPDRFRPGRSLYTLADRHIIESVRWHKGQALVKLSGVNDRDAAEDLRSQYLQAPETDFKPLDEGEYYHFQLIGLGVRTTDGQPIGKLTRIMTTGANDVYVVYGMLGEILIPAIGDVVKEIDLEAGVMVVEAVPGLIPTRRRRLVKDEG
ncbi:MAG TPA: ribosome maturation factor RimM, partial [Dehalococcoidia bacterium]|nr:ribosome maturation factor RimM [Dehalococcoidia bacterium]